MPRVPSHTRSENIPLGVATIVGTVLMLSLGDAVIKGLGGSGALGLWQLFALRSAIALPLLIVGAGIAFGATALRPKHIGWVAVRSLLLCVMWLVYYAALPYLPLAVAAAAFYTLPLFIVAFAALFGGEVVGRAQIAGVGLGFLGILLVLQPGSEAFQWAALLPVFSAVLYALAMILTRTKCMDEHPVTLAVGLNVIFIAFGLGGLVFGPSLPFPLTDFLSPAWVPMAGVAWGIVGILAVMAALVSIGTAVAYQSAPASVVGTFDFAYVGFALIWSILFFDEVPNTLGLAGIGLIVLAGVLAVRRP